VYHKHVLKGLVERFLAIGTAKNSLFRSRVRSWGLVLAYHNVTRGEGAGQGDRSLHLPKDRFAKQLDLLVETCDVVPLTTILSPPVEVDRPRVVITFDDAYRGAVTWGVEELARRGLPATIFVAPEFVGGSSFWWDILADTKAPRDQYVDFRIKALQCYRGVDRVIRKHAARCGVVENRVDEYAVAANEAELQEAVAVPGITLGSHSWSHPDLTRLNDEELQQELQRPLQWLYDRFESVTPWLAYPYGRSSATVRNAVAEAGYTGALLVSGGWISPETCEPFEVPRLNVPSGMSQDGFALRIAGVL